MEKYDVVVVGGGIAGSIAARLAAENGLKSLLIEKAKTPRNKPCSGIQFSYFEKLVGRPIPKATLCANEIYNIYIITPDDITFKAKMKVFNFWRSTFDHWLNDLAVEEGAIFQDQTRMIDFEQANDGIRLHLQKGTESREILASYLIAADGMSSRIRKKLHPDDYFSKASGGAMNYYCTGEGDLDPNGLYMVNIKEYAPMMFAWIYKKDDLWVIGTGTENEPFKDYVDRFYTYVCNKYHFRGEIVRREGFASPLKGGVCLGEGNILLCGDAAGLMDAYRGVAMDNAALSARFAVQAILDAEKSGKVAFSHYAKTMERMNRQIEVNEVKRKVRFASNETLTASMNPYPMLIAGIKMKIADLANGFLPPERVITLPL
jgi:flavin-dependent dehydrogenase